ncbi:hypothetical protein BaRGS_00009995, partial [Batillaria attramentaria]
MQAEAGPPAVIEVEFIIDHYHLHQPVSSSRLPCSSGPSCPQAQRAGHVNVSPLHLVICPPRPLRRFRPSTDRDEDDFPGNVPMYIVIQTSPLENLEPRFRLEASGFWTPSQFQLLVPQWAVSRPISPPGQSKDVHDCNLTGDVNDALWFLEAVRRSLARGELLEEGVRWRVI